MMKLAFLAAGMAAMLVFAGLSLRMIMKKYHNKAMQQRALFSCFTAALFLYYACGACVSIFVFDHSALNTFGRLAGFMDIPVYALVFLFLASLYLLMLLGNGIRKEKPETALTAAGTGSAVIATGTGSSAADLADSAGSTDSARSGIRGSLSSFVRSHPVFSYLLIYTILFVIIFCGVFAANLTRGRGLIWRVDGKPQYLPYMDYMANYLRDTFTRFINHDYTIKMYDFTIGMGEDFRAVFRIHPSEFLSAFFSRDHLEALYDNLVVIRYYIAGLTFTLFCRRHRLPWQNILIASFCYLFSGYGIHYAMKHPIFVSPMILLPLLLIGLERVINKEGYGFYVLIVALSMSTSYYFLYMSTAAMGFYALVHFGSFYKEHRIREFFGMMGRIIGSYLLGIGIAAVFFLPTVIRALTSERVAGSENALPSLLSYSSQHGIKVFLGSISGRYTGYDFFLSFAAILLPCLVVLFLRKPKDHAGLKILVIIECIFIMVPVYGYIMSGGVSTINNRWIYAVALTGAYLIAAVLGDLRTLTKLQMIGIWGITLLYGLCAYKMMPLTRFSLDISLSLRVLVLTTGIITCVNLFRVVTREQFSAVILLLTAISLMVQGAYAYGNDIEPFTKSFMTSGTEADEFFNKTEFKHFSDLEDDSFYRIDVAAMRDYYENTGTVFGYYSTSIYNSVINKNLINYHVEMGSSGIGAVHRVYNMDGRIGMEALAGVKYYQVNAGKDACIPYGFTKNEALSDNEFWVYENQYPLGIGYCLDTLLSEASYNSLSPLEKEQALLKAAVVSDDTLRAEPVLTDLPMTEDSSTLLAGEDILYKTPSISDPDERFAEEGSSFEVMETADTLGLHSTLYLPETGMNAGFTLHYETKKGYETFLYLEDFCPDIERAKIYLLGDNLEKTVIARNASGTYSLPRNDYYVNLGYADTSGEASLRFQFNDEAEYDIRDIKICYVPLKNYEKDIKKLQKNQLRDVSLSENTVTGNISLTEDQLLILSIPYAAGWTAYVDGEEASLIRVDTLYSGIPLKAGDHQIIMSYETPGLKIGGIISGCCLIIFIVLTVVLSMRKRKRKEA